MLYCLNFTILLIFYGVKPGKSFQSVLNDTILTVNIGTNSNWICLKDAKKSSSGLCMSQSPGIPQIPGRRKQNGRLGQTLYDAWTKTGKCEPTVMAKIEKAVE